MVPLVVSVVLAFVLGPCYFVDGSWSARSLSLISFVALGVGMAEPRPPARVLASAAVAGTSGAVLWVASPSQWIHVLLATALRLLLAPSTARERLLLTVPVIVPGALLGVSALPGLDDARRVLIEPMRNAVPDPATAAVHGAAIAAALWLCVRRAESSGTDVSRRALFRSAAVTGVALGAVAWALFTHARATLTEVLLPFDAHQWSESPLLLNVLKMREHVPLFSDPFEVRSYTYSPTFELIQAAILSPFHRSLDIVSHRVLVVGWQIATAVIVACLLFRRLGGRAVPGRLSRAALCGSVVLLLEWVSPASPYLHPDHAVHAAVAATIGLLLVDGAPSKRVLVGLVLAAVFAFVFKLTGVGVGLGLGLIAALERRRDLAACVAVAAALSLASLALYNAVFGRFTDYAVVLMSRHPLASIRLIGVPVFPIGRWIIAGLVLGLAAGAGGQRSARRLALLAVGIGAVTILAYLKDGGRANNLVAPALPALVLAFLWSGERAGRRYSDVASLCALSALTLGELPDSGVARARISTLDQLTALHYVRDDLAAGRHPLVQSGTSLFLRAGGQGVPWDQLHPAIELFLAGHPAFETFLARLASGRYDTIVTPGTVFTSRTASGLPFGQRLQFAVKPRYCVVYPLGDDGRPVTLDLGQRLIILRRRELGCEPWQRSSSSERN